MLPSALSAVAAFSNSGASFLQCPHHGAVEGSVGNNVIQQASGVDLLTNPLRQSSAVLVMVHEVAIPVVGVNIVILLQG